MRVTGAAQEVQGCIFKQGDEKPVMKWSFLTKIEVEDLASFLRNLKSSEIDQRAKDLRGFEISKE